MRIKMERDRARGAELLLVRLSRGEELDSHLLEWLQLQSRQHILELAFDITEHPLALRYDITGLKTLKDFLHSGDLSSLQYGNALVSCAEVVATCMQEDIPTQCLCYSDQQVYADDDGFLWFMLYPTKLGVPHPREASLAALLHTLSKSRNLSFAEPEDALRAHKLARIASEVPFSFAAFQAFLAHEYGVCVDNERPASAAPRRDVVRTMVRSPRAGFVSRDDSLVGGQYIEEDCSSELYAFDRYRTPKAQSEPPVEPGPVVSQETNDRVDAPQVRQNHELEDDAKGSPHAQNTKDKALPCEEEHPQKQEEATSEPKLEGSREEEVFPELLSLEQQPQEADGLDVPVDLSFLEEGSSSLSLGQSTATQVTVADKKPLPKKASSKPQVPQEVRFELVSEDTDRIYPMGDAAMILVGRGSGNDVQILDNPKISRTHARLGRRGDRFEIEDLGSANGTFVGGKALREGQVALVRLGEPLMLADATFCIRREITARDTRA